MAILNHKIDFVVLVSVDMANANGDPLNGNRPRTNYDGYGEMSDVCIKRKIRNRMQDLGQRVFVQSDDRCDDGCTSLKNRADSVPELKEINSKGKKATFIDKDDYSKIACDRWIDVRSFGQVFAFGNISVGVRGPVSIHPAQSVSPIDVYSMQITKSVNGEDGDKKGSDTMGSKHFVRYGLYTIKGSINVQLAEKTGFSDEDAETLKECLRTLFVNDSSSARPDGSMEVVKVYWFEHNCKIGQYSSAQVHRSVKVTLKDGVSAPSSPDDYDITVESLEDLIPEEITGV
ncbi:MAG: type I-C CRISPR-associated protein Cas7/Csd2 [Oscillospiraceae bacterium]|nr:type I-C CRISPR-associated protein Cas7/Csd2 [Oscillospiraceae bacterium]